MVLGGCTIHCTVYRYVGRHLCQLNPGTYMVLGGCTIHCTVYRYVGRHLCQLNPGTYQVKCCVSGILAVYNIPQGTTSLNYNPWPEEMLQWNVSQSKEPQVPSRVHMCRCMYTEVCLPLALPTGSKHVQMYVKWGLLTSGTTHWQPSPHCYLCTPTTYIHTIPGGMKCIKLPTTHLRQVTSPTKIVGVNKRLWMSLLVLLGCLLLRCLHLLHLITAAFLLLLFLVWIIPEPRILPPPSDGLVLNPLLNLGTVLQYTLDLYITYMI